MSSTELNPPRPIVIWITPPGPNPWKAVWLLEELSLNYVVKSFRFDDVKKPPFINVNPNGRVPAIEDPNTGLTLWESGAIYQYLIEVYDTAHKLSYTDLNQRHLCNQWLHFQTSGQGPYYGQAGWFTHLHPEKIDSAIERYRGEIRRVLGVTERVLSEKPKDGEKWLVGDKMTFADMAFVPWNFRLAEVLTVSEDEAWDGFPLTRAWHDKMVATPSWGRAMKLRARLMDEQGLQWNGVPKGIETFTEYETKIAEAKEAESGDIKVVKV
ncbi:glutathione S-transferase [Apodospora peruviana]|uniref:glutathione transferase n=1 Tax=Apodospora peruviana TaxID=516989 RepID=A0AAE0MHI0_9PEZI|nr:glutathione S-transferase [Apodospora peruviana]